MVTPHQMLSSMEAVFSPTTSMEEDYPTSPTTISHTLLLLRQKTLLLTLSSLLLLIRRFLLKFLLVMDMSFLTGMQVVLAILVMVELGKLDMIIISPILDMVTKHMEVLGILMLLLPWLSQNIDYSAGHNVAIGCLICHHLC